MTPLSPLLTLVVTHTAQALPVQGPRAFRELGLEPALAAAREERKLVLLAFYRPGTPETKVMDTLTWEHAVCVRWLADRVVALKVDADAHPDWLARFGVTELPATLFLTAEGLEIERLVGVADADTVMGVGRASVKCGPLVSAARVLLASAPDDPELHVQLARAYATCGRYDRSAEEFLWAWDHGAGVPAFDAYRSRLLAYEANNLSRYYKPIRREFARRREALRARLFEWREGDDAVALARDLSSINSGLEADEQQEQVWSAARQSDKASEAVVRTLFTERLLSRLAREKRHAELLAGCGDALAYLDQLYAELTRRSVAAEAERNTAPSDPDEPLVRRGIDAIEVQRNGNLSTAGALLTALCATGNDKDAREVSRMVQVYDSRAQAILVLMRAACEGGRPDVARETAARGLESIEDPAERRRIEQALAEVPREEK